MGARLSSKNEKHRVDYGDLFNQRLPASNFSTVHPIVHAAHQKCETTRSLGDYLKFSKKICFEGAGFPKGLSPKGTNNH